MRLVKLITLLSKFFSPLNDIVPHFLFGSISTPFKLTCKSRVFLPVQADMIITKIIKTENNNSLLGFRIIKKVKLQASKTKAIY
jgi:hypothetical protein